MSAIRKPFPSYLEMQPRLPAAFWWTLRIATLVFTLAMGWLVAVHPDHGFALFWKVLVPSLPLIFALVPGFWRQICPMALMNQLPRTFGFAGGRTLPVKFKNLAYFVSAIAFFVLVSLRHVYFNKDPAALLALVFGALGLAFLDGLLFKGRSGWCGTFCPLAPIQKAYGHAPFFTVRNGYCPTCVGCQKNCFDFNPRAAFLSDLADPDPWYTGHKQFFVAGLPGFAFGFFTAADPATTGLFDYYLHLAQWIVTTLGIYMAMRIFIRMSELRAAALSAMAALVIFYWFTGPGIVGTLASFAGAEAPDWSREAIVAVVALVAIKVLFNGWSAERDFKALNKPQSGDPVKVGVKLDAVRAGGGSVAGDLVTDRASGRSFAADGSRTLLEGIESAGLTQDFGCRMGMCGADAVAVVEGIENLSPPGDDEVATLRRLGLEGRARMACVCRPMAGGVVIDLKMNPNDLPEPPPPSNLVDHGEQAGIERVVIIGNGAGGISAADEVRRLSPSVTIDVIARENQPFYNRMAIGRLLYGRTGLDDLFLMTPDWYAKKQIDVWLNTQAIAIDRENRLVSLGTGEQIPYDRLVLAMGSRATIPEAEGSDLPGCFVLREAADAQVIRAWRQTHACRHAVVQGGGVLGVEAADALRRLNLRTTIVQRSDRLMNRELDETGSAILQRFLGNLTIEVATGASVVRIIGDGRVQAVELTDGRILDADIYVACAGVQANTELAAAAGLQVDRGIVVDHSMRTSDPLIFAVGDVAQVPGAVSGLWPVATAQASVAAAALFGQEAKYEPPSTLVSLKMDSIDVKGFGNLKVGEGEEEIVHDEGDTVHRRLVISGGRIKGAVFVGPPGTAKPLPAAIQKRADLTAILPRLRNGDWAALSEL